jgi:hypothetical protein
MQDLPWPRSDDAGPRIDLNWGRGAVTGCDAVRAQVHGRRTCVFERVWVVRQALRCPIPVSQRILYVDRMGTARGHLA